MIRIETDIFINNPLQPENKTIKTKAVVDAHMFHLCIPQTLADQLKLSGNHKRKVELEDGKTKLCPYVGPLELKFGARACYTGAVVMGDEVHLGALPMDDLDLVVNPKTQKVTANPKSPLIPLSTIIGSHVEVPMLKQKIKKMAADDMFKPDEDGFEEF